MKDRLIVALDAKEPAEAIYTQVEINGLVSTYKIGSQLLYHELGTSYVHTLMGMGKKIFLDIKLLDTPDTMRKAIETIGKVGYSFVTVHSNSRETLQALMEVKPPTLKILVVTTLTSQEAHSTEVLMKAIRAHESGVDGVIASAHEAELIRKATNDKFLIVTPGIRLAIDPHHDQKRVATPYQAIKAGADYLVVGRSITTATDPRKAVLDIINDMERA